MNRIKYAILGMIMIMFVLTGVGCEKINENTTLMQEGNGYKQGEKQCVINIDYQPNLIFAKDNLDIYIDETKVYTIANGEEKMYTFSLAKGEHTLKLSSGMFHSKKITFEIKDNGDVFAFVAKNHTNKLELWLSESFNYYTSIGQEIPVDDETAQQVIQGESIKQGVNKGIGSKIWSFIKAIVLFVIIATIFACVGMLMFELFKTINLVDIGLGIVFVILIGLGIINRFNIIVLVLIILYLIGNIIFLGKKKNIPKKYKGFRVVIEAEKTSYLFLYSYVCPVLVLAIPKLLEILPFTIHNINLYMYFYIALVLVMAVTGVEKEMNFLEELSECINRRTTIGMLELEDFLEAHMDSNSTENDRKKYADKLKICLDDFTRLGMLEIDQVNQCYRKV